MKILSKARTGYMSASYVADTLRDFIRLRMLQTPPEMLTIAAIPMPVADIDRLHLIAVAGMDTPHFDMTLNDGRVYRVRVSDITPEKELVDAV